MNGDFDTIRVKDLQIIDNEERIRIRATTGEDGHPLFAMLDEGSIARVVIATSPDFSVIEIRNAHDKCQVRIDLREEIAVVGIQDKTGMRRIGISLVESDPQLTLMDWDGHPRLQVGLKDRKAELLANEGSGLRPMFSPHEPPQE